MLPRRRRDGLDLSTDGIAGHGCDAAWDVLPLMRKAQALASERQLQDRKASRQQTLANSAGVSGGPPTVGLLRDPLPAAGWLA